MTPAHHNHHQNNHNTASMAVHQPPFFRVRTTLILLLLPHCRHRHHQTMLLSFCHPPVDMSRVPVSSTRAGSAQKTVDQELLQDGSHRPLLMPWQRQEEHPSPRQVRSCWGCSTTRRISSRSTCHPSCRKTKRRYPFPRRYVSEHSFGLSWSRSCSDMRTVVLLVTSKTCHAVSAGLRVLSPAYFPILCCWLCHSSHLVAIQLMLLLTHVEQQPRKHPTAPLCIAWSMQGRAFAIHNQDQLVKHILPQFFPQAKFSSFTRKLYRWGFRQLSTIKVSDDHSDDGSMTYQDMPGMDKAVSDNGRKGSSSVVTDRELLFGHEYFQRDNKALMSKMRSVTAAGTRRALAAMAMKQRKDREKEQSSSLPMALSPKEPLQHSLREEQEGVAGAPGPQQSPVGTVNGVQSTQYTEHPQRSPTPQLHPNESSPPAPSIPVPVPMPSHPVAFNPTVSGPYAPVPGPATPLLPAGQSYQLPVHVTSLPQPGGAQPMMLPSMTAIPAFNAAAAAFLMNTAAHVAAAMQQQMMGQPYPQAQPQPQPQVLPGHIAQPPVQAVAALPPSQTGMQTHFEGQQQKHQQQSSSLVGQGSVSQLHPARSCGGGGTGTAIVPPNNTPFDGVGAGATQSVHGSTTQEGVSTVVQETAQSVETTLTKTAVSAPPKGPTAALPPGPGGQ